MIKDKLDTRPFPPGDRIDELPRYQQEIANHIKNEVISGMRDQLAGEVKDLVEEELEKRDFDDMKNYYKQLLIEEKKKTFDPESYLKEQEEKEERLAKEMLLIQPKIESELKEEALKEWNKKPDSERLEKKWFKVKEKTEERSKYISAYIEKYRESRINTWLKDRKSDM